MFPNCPVGQEHIQLYIDGELSSHDADKFSHHLEECPSCQDSYELLTEEQQLIQHYLQQQSSVAEQQVDWDAFERRMATELDRTEQEPSDLYQHNAAPCPSYYSLEVVKSSPSWIDQITAFFQWWRERPVFSVSCAAVCTILFIIALPQFDADPTTQNDQIVEKAIKKKNSEVAAIKGKTPPSKKVQTPNKRSEPFEDFDPKIFPSNPNCFPKKTP